MLLFLSNSSCVPTPSILPSSNTIILSASLTLEILCAIIIFVVSGISSLKAFLIFASVTVSTALVLSSRIRILGFLSNALAIHNRCFCPPDTLEPPCSIYVLYLDVYKRQVFGCLFYILKVPDLKVDFLLKVRP